MRQRLRIISHHEVEGGGIMGVMLLVVMDKFCKGKMLNPCFRVGATIDPKVHF
jgi:hypothetical protein